MNSRCAGERKGGERSSRTASETNDEGSERATERRGGEDSGPVAARIGVGEPGRVVAEIGAGRPRWPGPCGDEKGSRWLESITSMAKSRCRRLRKGMKEPRRWLVITGSKDTEPSLARPMKGMAKPACPEDRKGSARSRRKESITDVAGPRRPWLCRGDVRSDRRGSRTDAAGSSYAVLLKDEEGPRWVPSVTNGEERKPVRDRPKVKTVKSDLADDLIDGSKPDSPRSSRSMAGPR